MMVYNNNYQLFLPNNSPKIFHQNIWKLKYKTTELLSSLHSDLLHIIGITDITSID